jgi:1,4-dihydroxy-2-naphthoate polyprenyltransferase
MRITKILLIIRFHIVAGGALAFLLGALLANVAGGSFDFMRVGLVYLVVFLGDLSTHYSNDYFDVEVDQLGERRKFFSGSRILVSYPNLRFLAKSVSVSLLVLSDVVAALLVVFFGLPAELLVIAVGANFLGWFYSAPPMRLISRGLGEIVVAVVAGLVIPAVGYLAVCGSFDWLFAFFAVPFVLYGLMLSLSLGVPDRELDLKSGKRNFAVRRGELGVFVVIQAGTCLASLTFFVFAWLRVFVVIDFWLVFLFSLVPLIAGVAGLTGVLQKRNVSVLSGVNIASLFLLNALMVIYLLFAVFVAA